MEEFKGTKKVYAVEYAGTIFMNEGPHYEDENVLDMSRVGDEVAWANAKLYESAPDLLEALQESNKDLIVLHGNICQELKKGNSQWEGVDEIIYKRIEQNKQAIAKALWQ